MTLVAENSILEAGLEDGLAYYKRISEGETVTSRKIHGLSYIKLLPLYPVSTPVFLTNYVLPRLAGQIDVSSGGESSFLRQDAC